MKFVSKYSNHTIILKPGLPGIPQLGTPATETIFVKFVNGVADISNQELVDKMLSHPRFGIDFLTHEAKNDPYASNRKEIEPTHVITEMQFGQPTKKTVGTTGTSLPPELSKLIEAQATELAKKLLPGMMEEFLKNMQAESKAQVDTGRGSSPIAAEVTSPEQVEAAESGVVANPVVQEEGAPQTAPVVRKGGRPPKAA